MQRSWVGLMLLVLLGGVLAGTACGIKAAPRPPLPPPPPPGTSQPRGERVQEPPRPSLLSEDSGTP